MKYIRLYLTMASAFFFMQAEAQLSAFINGKPVKAGTSVNKADLPSLELSFKNAKNPTVAIGKLVLLVQINDLKDKEIEEWYILKDGYSAFNDFLKSTPATKKFKVFGQGSIFRQNGNNLDWVMKSSLGLSDRQNVKIKVSMFFREEIGYREYGDAVYLLDDLSLNVPLYDVKKVPLPYLDLSIDKSNIGSDIETKQNGRIDDARTDVGYELQDNKNFWYRIYTLDGHDHYPGLDTKETADDFIHAATLYANFNNVSKFKDYDIAKFTLPWDDMSALLNSKLRLQNLSYRVNKSVKGMDLMTLMTPVEINGLKGYTFRSPVQYRSDINATDWKDKGQFVIYILNHPTNPQLTLIISSSLNNTGNNVEETDAFLKTIINSIKAK